ncbi:hypothetical protein JD292_06530 [Leucobacter sp. CSA2]|uniref:Lipoprotein n=1 Tax=Leucobacter edaphi TaxID=2796472 RepID=A0A934UY65_9MICO|nr:hypothetical protein [Leucobacter edaphi]MBK0421727.1 hypothetical protein [Leucobacter edaphi]
MEILAKWVLPLALVGTLFTTGCTIQGKPEMHSSQDSDKPGQQVNPGLTWQKAKSDTQETEQQIADLIPKELVESVKQQSVGMLFQCSNGQHQWGGGTIVNLRQDSDFPAAIRTLEKHYQTAGGGYSVKVGDDAFGYLQLTLTTSRDDGEAYLVSTGLEKNQLNIDSRSPCFTLPEGVYPGGDF